MFQTGLTNSKLLFKVNKNKKMNLVKNKEIPEKNAHQTYQMFDKVLKLTVNQQVQGISSEQVGFRDLLLRLRKAESTVDNWKLLLTRQPSNITNLWEFDDSPRPFYSNEQVGNYNHEQLT